MCTSGCTGSRVVRNGSCPRRWSSDGRTTPSAPPRKSEQTGMRIIVGGVISRHPFVPGSVWNRMHWTVGLQRLGHEVFYVEQIRPRWSVDEEGRACPFERCINRQHFARTMHRFGLSSVSCQIFNDGEATSGLSLPELLTIARSADLLINHSGH